MVTKKKIPKKIGEKMTIPFQDENVNVKLVRIVKTLNIYQRFDNQEFIIGNHLDKEYFNDQFKTIEDAKKEILLHEESDSAIMEEEIISLRESLNEIASKNKAKINPYFLIVGLFCFFLASFIFSELLKIWNSYASVSPLSWKYLTQFDSEYIRGSSLILIFILEGFICIRYAFKKRLKLRTRDNKRAKFATIGLVLLILCGLTYAILRNQYGNLFSEIIFSILIFISTSTLFIIYDVGGKLKKEK